MDNLRNYNDDLLYGFDYQYPNNERQMKDLSSFVFGKDKNAEEDLQKAFLSDVNLDYLKFALKSSVEPRCYKLVDELTEGYAVDWWRARKYVLYHNGFPYLKNLPYTDSIDLSFDNNTKLERLNGLFLQEAVDTIANGPRRDENEYQQYSELYKEIYHDASGMNYPILYRDRNAEAFCKIIKSPYRNNNKIPMYEIILHNKNYEMDIDEALSQPYERDNLRRKFDMSRLQQDRSRHRQLLNDYPEISQYPNFYKETY